jgi:hypothetical protein
VLIYKVLFVSVGLRHFVPYLAIALLVHVGNGIALFFLVRKAAGDLAALLSASLLMLLGSAAIAFYYVFSIDFLLSVFFGLLAALVLQLCSPSWRWALLAATCLTLGLMSSSIGLVFLIANGGWQLWIRSWRRFSAVLLIPFALYAAWAYTFLSATAHVQGISTAAVIFAARLLSRTIAAVAGLPAGVGGAGILVLAAVVVVTARRHQEVRPLVAWAVAGTVVELAILGAARAQEGGELSRYFYTLAPFTLVLLACAVGKLLQARGVFGLVLLAIIPVLVNVAMARDFLRYEEVLTAKQDAALAVIATFRDSHGLDLDSSLNWPIIWGEITPRRYYSITDRLGSPVTSSSPADLKHLPPDMVNRTVAALFQSSLARTQHPGTAGGPCQQVPRPTGLTMVLPSSSTLWLRAAKPAVARLSLWLLGPAPIAPPSDVAVAADQQTVIRLPGTGPTFDWHLRVEAGSVDSELTLCQLDAASSQDQVTANSPVP